jgi:hypothetical protein
MAIEFVEKHDTFDTWRTKTNQISLNVGDLNLLTTPSTSDIVSAINSMNQQLSDNIRKAVILSIALN